jgi:hypothetical protein
MSGNPEATACDQSEIERTSLTRQQEEVEIQDLLFSEKVSSICYWGAILLLAVVSAYLIRCEIGHTIQYGAPANDFWGITTPPWLVVPLAPLGTLLSLGHAVWSALQGQRTWRMVMSAAGLVLVVASGTLFDTSR